MRKNPLTQKVNFYLSICFIFVFGLFMTTKIVNAVRTNVSTDNPILDSVDATHQALAN